MIALATKKRIIYNIIYGHLSQNIQAYIFKMWKRNDPLQFILLLSPQDGNPVIWLATGVDIQAHLDCFDPTQAALNNYNFTYSSLYRDRIIKTWLGRSSII